MRVLMAFMLGFVFLELGTACTPADSSALSERLAAGRPRPDPPASDTARSNSSAGPSAESSEVLARVNDRPIFTAPFQQLLSESHGLFVLEQLVALELVKDHAHRQSVSLSDVEIEAEWDRALRDLGRAAVARDSDIDPRAAGQEMLDQFLGAKNISLAEFKLSIERHAYLRKMVEAEVTVTDEEVRAEFERRHGRQAVVRHIVLPDLKAVGEVRARLRDGGDFADLARAYSVHRLSGAAGGLLPIFTQGDVQVPPLLRSSAFAMQPGAVSDALAIDGQYHLIRLEQFIEPQEKTFDAALAEEVRAGLADIQLRTRMDELERRLFKQAHFRIFDSALQRQFDEKHQDQ